MKGIGLAFRGRHRGPFGPVGQELDLTHAAMNAWSELEHDAEGHHTTITADSIVDEGAMSFGGPWTLPTSAVITPPIITANQDDYNPIGWATGIVLRLETDAPHDLTGLVTVTSAYHWGAIFNIGNFNLVLKHNVTSTAVYRFACPGGADVTLNSGDSVWLWYDSRAGNWRVMGV